MMTEMEEFAFAIYPEPFMDRSAAGAWFRDAMESVGLDELGLHPMQHAESWWANNEELLLAGGAVLTHPAFAEESGDPGWAMTLYYMDWPTRGGILGTVPVWPEDASGRSLVWPWLASMLERLVVAADADLVFVNGNGPGGDDERLASEEEIASDLPPAVTAWTFLGPARLNDERRTALAALPAFESRALGKGWLLRPVEHYEDRLPAGFLKAYSAIVGKPAEYLRAG